MISFLTIGKETVASSPSLIRFLTDTKFIRYVLEGEEDLGAFWKAYLSEKTEERVAFCQAERILRNLDMPQEFLAPLQVEKLQHSIKLTLGI